MKLDTLIALTQASYHNMKQICHSSCFVEYLLYPIACCLPQLRNSVNDNSSFF